MSGTPGAEKLRPAYSRGIRHPRISVPPVRGEGCVAHLYVDPIQPTGLSSAPSFQPRHWQPHSLPKPGSLADAVSADTRRASSPDYRDSDAVRPLAAVLSGDER